MLKSLRDLVRSNVPRLVLEARRFGISGVLLARLIDRYTGSSGGPVSVALYDASIDTVKVPQSGRELVADLRRGMIADAVPWMLKMDQQVPADGIVFDIGAYRGVTAQWFAKRSGRVYAFEPLPESVTSIELALSIAGIHNVTVVDRAVDALEQERDLFVYEIRGHNSFGRVRTSRLLGRFGTSTVTIDAFCKEKGISRIDLMKVDAEGFEKEVLEGASYLLSCGRIKKIVFELSPMVLSDLGRGIETVFGLLQSYGYEIQDMAGNTISLNNINKQGFHDLVAIAPEGASTTSCMTSKEGTDRQENTSGEGKL